MTREEYIRYCQSKSSKSKRKTHPMASVTDPIFAQTGRQMIETPLPINYRAQYQAGAPLDKDNPLQVAEYDKMYGDTFESMKQAKQQVATTKQQVQRAHEHYQQQQQQQQES